MSDDVDADAVAGVADLFGALTRAELEAALSELAYRRGEELDDDVVDDALEAFALVAIEPDDRADPAGETLFAPGPGAFPTLPDGAEDLPHILDADSRDLDREVVGRAAERRFRREAAAAVDDGDAARAAELLDVSYDVEAWTPVDLSSVRTRLDDLRDATN